MADLNEIHKHHIVPRYKCEELGINPDFDGNTVDTTRKQHALIHWGYHCNDLSPLLEICNPPQYVQDMIPLGDKRDNRAAVFIALGEVEGIVPLSGKDHPNYKHGRTIGTTFDPIMMKIYRNTPEYKEQRKVWDKKYRDNPENKSVQKAYLKEYRDKPGNKEKQRGYAKAWNEKNKEKIKINAKKNKDYFREYLKEYYIKNKEKINAKARERYARKKLKKATATLDNFM